MVETIDLRGELVSKVQDGLSAALWHARAAAAAAVCVTSAVPGTAAATVAGVDWEHSLCRHVDILQRFVDKHKHNSTRCNHSCSGRGGAMCIRLCFAQSLLAEGTALSTEIRIHANVSAQQLHTLVEGLDMLRHLDGSRTSLRLRSSTLRGGAGAPLARGQQTMHELGISGGDEVRVELAMDSAPELHARSRSYSPGGQISQSAEWFGLLFELLELPLKPGTRQQIWNFLMRMPSGLSELQRVTKLDIHWGGHTLRTTYSLQVIDALLLPSDGSAMAAVGEVNHEAQEWRQRFVQSGAFGHFLTFLETLDERLGGAAECTVVLPVCLRVLNICVTCALASGSADADVYHTGLALSLAMVSAIFGAEARQTLRLAVAGAAGQRLVSTLLVLVRRAYSTQQRFSSSGAVSLMQTSSALRLGSGIIHALMALDAIVATDSEQLGALLGSDAHMELLVELLVRCADVRVQQQARKTLSAMARLSETAWTLVSTLLGAQLRTLPVRPAPAPSQCRHRLVLQSLKSRDYLSRSSRSTAVRLFL